MQFINLIINIIVLGFYISMFTDIQAKRLNRLTWNLKHRLLWGQVNGWIRKKWTFSPGSKIPRSLLFFFAIFIPSSNKKTLIDFFYKFKFNIFKTHKQVNIIKCIKYIRIYNREKSIYVKTIFSSKKVQINDKPIPKLLYWYVLKYELRACIYIKP